MTMTKTNGTIQLSNYMLHM